MFFSSLLFSFLSCVHFFLKKKKGSQDSKYKVLALAWFAVLLRQALPQDPSTTYVGRQTPCSVPYLYAISPLSQCLSPHKSTHHFLYFLKIYTFY